MNREIKFKAAYPLKTGTVIIDNVVVYRDQTLGCSRDDFDRALPSEHYIDSIYSIIEHRIKDPNGEYDYNPVGSILSELDEWIHFQGKPLQFTGVLDFNRNEIYEGHILQIGDKYAVKWDYKDSCWALDYLGRGELSALRYYDPSLLTILGFIDQNPSLI